MTAGTGGAPILAAELVDEVHSATNTVPRCPECAAPDVGAAAPTDETPELADDAVELVPAGAVTGHEPAAAAAAVDEARALLGRSRSPAARARSSSVCSCPRCTPAPVEVAR